MEVNVLKTKLNTLNENQLKAVIQIDKPLFVVAGAGTGKTNTLTTKIAYLISKLNVNPESILAVTFTNKAAREIRDRVNALVFPKQTGSWLYTFHAFSLRILRSHAIDLNINYTNNFQVIDEDDSLKIIRDIIERENLDKNRFKPKIIKNNISKHKSKIERLIDSEEYLVYEQYQKELIKDDLMDFDDLILYTYKLFNNDESILNKYQNIFKYVLVDEFQDTDKLQYEIIKLINAKNTFVVGDPDQSIYGFRGARYENNQKFIEDFNAEVIVLDLNYRSTNNILKAANKLISNNKDRTTEKDLVSNLGDGKTLYIERFENSNDENNFVVNEIIRLINRGTNPSDIAVLYRNNALSRGFEHLLMRYQIPYTVYGGISFYERREIKDILAYINVIISDRSDFFLKRIINVPSRKIGKVTVSKLETYATINQMTMFNAIDHIDTLNSETKKRLLQFKEIILKMRDEVSKIDNLTNLIDIVVNESNYQQLLSEEIDEVAADRRNNILELKNVFYEANYYEGNNFNKIQKTLDELALFSSLDVKEVVNTVKLATVHQVKGLEFKVVFVVSLEEEIFPNHRVKESLTKLYEERRLFYVAITRAKEMLYLTNAKTRFMFGQNTFQRQSKFVDEIIINNSDNNKIDNINVDLYKPGDVIVHNSFGRGVVVSYFNNILTIAFGYEVGIKKINDSFPGMRKENENEKV